MTNLKKYCSRAASECRDFNAGRCNAIHKCPAAVDMYSILSAEFRQISMTYMGKILENQQEILRRLENQK